MLRTVLFLIGILFALRVVLGWIIKAGGALFGSSEQAASSPTPVGGELVKDPVCGTYVSDATALKKSVSGTTYYFCSQACKEKFGQRAS
jgi:YHS domain-containing protein